jgi:hypothetical protein
MHPAEQMSIGGRDSGGGPIGGNCWVRSTSPSSSGATGTNLHKKLTANWHGSSDGSAIAGAGSSMPPITVHVNAISVFTSNNIQFPSGLF